MSGKTGPVGPFECEGSPQGRGARGTRGPPARRQPALPSKESPYKKPVARMVASYNGNTWSDLAFVAFPVGCAKFTFEHFGRSADRKRLFPEIDTPRALESGQVLPAMLDQSFFGA